MPIPLSRPPVDDEIKQAPRQRDPDSAHVGGSQGIGNRRGRDRGAGLFRQESEPLEIFHPRLSRLMAILRNLTSSILKPA
jgi:hypothetical protein